MIIAHKARLCFFVLTIICMSYDLHAKEISSDSYALPVENISSAAREISRLSIQDIVFDNSVLRVLTDGKLPEFSSIHLSKPARLVIDLPGVSNQLSNQIYKSEAGLFSSVNVVSYSDKLRLIIEFKKNTVFFDARIDSTPTGLVINISEGDKPVAVAKKTPYISPVTQNDTAVSRAKPKVDGAVTSQGHVASVKVDHNPETTRVKLNISGNCSISDPEIVLNGISVSFGECIVPTNWQGNVDTANSNPVIKSVTLFPGNISKNVEAGMLIELIQQTRFSFSKDKQSLLISLDMAGASSVSSPAISRDTSDQKSATPSLSLSAASNDSKPGTKAFSGKKVTMEFDNADLRQIFRLLGEVSGDNIIIGDDVKGSYTIKLKEVPWDQALEMILVNNNLEIARYGNVIEIITYDKIKKRRDQSLEKQKQLFEQKREEARMRTIGLAEENKSDEVVTAQCQVQNATAADILPALKLLLSKYQTMATSNVSVSTSKTDANVTPQTGGIAGSGGLSGEATFDKSTTRQSQSVYKAEYGEMFPETNTNTIIINDRLDIIRKAETIISALDVAKKQVLIEARLIEASTSFTKELGIQWGSHYRDGSASLLGINSLDTGFGGIASTAPQSGTFGPGMSTGISFGTLASTVRLDARLSAAASLGTVKIISSPKVVTSYGVTATITQGQQIPYTSSSGSPPQVETKFILAALKLDVTPKITPSGNVLLDLKISNDSAGTGSPPPINTKQAMTQLTIPNNETAVIGGIMTNSETDFDQGVPFLMDIPFLGNLFKSKSSTKVQTEMLIFLTPRLLDFSQNTSITKTECKIIR